MSQSIRLGAAVAAVLLSCPVVAPAHVRLRTPDGVPLEWRRGCPSFTIAVSAGPDVAAGDMASLLEDARDAWTAGAGGCGRLPIEIVGHDGVGGVEYDGTSLVMWRPADHCRDPAHDDDEVCLSPNAAAVTTLWFHERGDRAGEIVEADIEINGAIAFGLDGEAGSHDLRSTITHELGHALGLEHTCEAIPGRAPLLDASGAVVPSCFPSVALPAEIRAATMYPYLSPGDLEGRTPLDDERGAICTLYRDHAGTCEDTGPGCGCQSDGGGATLVLGGVVILWTARRRRRAAMAARQPLP